MALPFLHKFRARARVYGGQHASWTAKTCDWPLSMIGLDGPQMLSFDVLGMGEPAPRAAGIFIYAKRTHDQQWQALFVGESSNLRNRLAFNEIAADALLSGATDIHVLLTNSNTASRRDICEKLIFTNRPPLNEDLTTTPPKPSVRPGPQRPASASKQTTNAA